MGHQHGREGFDLECECSSGSSHHRCQRETRIPHAPRPPRRSASWPPETKKTAGLSRGLPPPPEPAVGIEPTTARLRIGCSTTELRWRFQQVPKRGFEPRRLSAPPPQDGVSTSFTIWALHAALSCGQNSSFPAGLTGLEPATSGVTVRHSNQLSYSPSYFPAIPATPTTNDPKGNRTPLCTVKGCRPSR